jgi:hypothetical protein
MANEKDPLEAFTAMAAQTVDYFDWLQSTMPKVSLELH